MGPSHSEICSLVSDGLATRERETDRDRAGEQERGQSSYTIFVSHVWRVGRWGVTRTGREGAQLEPRLLRVSQGGHRQGRGSLTAGGQQLGKGRGRTGSPGQRSACEQPVCPVSRWPPPRRERGCHRGGTGVMGWEPPDPPRPDGHGCGSPPPMALCPLSAPGHVPSPRAPAWPGPRQRGRSETSCARPPGSPCADRPVPVPHCRQALLSPAPAPGPR